MVRAWTPAATTALVAGGLVFALALGQASRPRWSGHPRWWPVGGAPGTLLYGLAAGAVLGLAFDTARYLGVEASELQTVGLASVYVVGLSLAARLGGKGPDPTRPHLVAGGAVILLAYGGYVLLEWAVDRAWGGSLFG